MNSRGVGSILAALTVVLLGLSTIGCTEEGQHVVETQVARAAQTSVAAAQTQAIRAGQTAIADTVGAAKTEVAQRLPSKATATPVAPTTGFTVDTDLTVTVSVSGAKLDTAIKAVRADSPLIGMGQTFVDVGAQQGINAFYIAAHAAWESAWGTSKLASGKNNLFGYGAFDSCPYECAYSYASKDECVRQVMAIVKANYLTPGGKYYNGPTLRGMNVKYATDKNWMNGIASIMNRLSDKAR